MDGIQTQLSRVGERLNALPGGESLVQLMGGLSVDVGVLSQIKQPLFMRNLMVALQNAMGDVKRDSAARVINSISDQSRG